MSQNVSRQFTTVTVPANNTAKQPIDGDYFFIFSMTGPLSIAVNGGQWTPCQTSLLKRGAPGRNDFERLDFKNDTGAPVQVVIIYGRGDMEISGQVNLSPADLAVLTPAPRTIDWDVVEITGSQAFAGKTTIEVTNTGETDITVAPAGGAPRPVAPGRVLALVALRPQDVFKTCTVDATGGAARVVWTA